MVSTAFVHGFTSTAMLIMAIGAQNAFVLRQGLRREHVMPVVLVCALSDAVLLQVGVWGMGGVLLARPEWAQFMRWAGALFLLMYAAQTAARALRPGQLLVATSGPGTSLRTTLATVVEHSVPVNAGSIDMLHQLGEQCRAQGQAGHRVWLRINPGFGHGHSNKTNTGGEHSKHGIWHTDLPLALQTIREQGLTLAGLHMHIGSGVDYGHLAEVCGAMVELVRTAHAAGHDLHAISAGGGLSIPYRAGDPVIDTQHYFGLWNTARQQAEAIVGHKLGLEIEPGRFLVAESGVLLGEVRATKNAGSNHFVLVDTGFNELMRPSMYGSFHAMSVLRRDGSQGASQPTVVAGPLCESGDVFTQGDGGVVLPRDLPAAQVGDLLVIHDTGAYGASMSSNYNTRPLVAEVLVDGAEHRLIRRRQTVEELLSLELGL